MKSFLVCLIAVVLLAGCMGKSVVGKWTYTLLGQSATLELKDDNTFTFGSSSTSARAGTYEYKDGKVHLKFGSSESENMVLTLSEDGKTLNGTLLGLNVALAKQE